MGAEPNMHTGGYLSTAALAAITYLSGWLLSLSGWLGDAWAHVTPGQAALLIGLLTYGTHTLGPKLRRLGARALYRAAAGMRRTREGEPPNKSKERARRMRRAGI